MQYEENEDPINQGRPTHGPPVQLFCREFDEFIKNYKFIEIDKHDIKFVYKLQDSMKKKFGVEKTREKEVRKLFGEYLGASFEDYTYPLGKARPVTDGSIYVDIGEKCRILLVNLEVKNELGTT
jgi:hypothetical protein